MSRANRWAMGQLLFPSPDGSLDQGLRSASDSRQPAVGSRFANLSRPRAAVVIVALLLAIVGAGLATMTAPGPRFKQAELAEGDADLYRSIIAGVRGGEPYYAVTARELRDGHYPLKPFVTFRLPTLAWVEARLSPAAVHGLQWLLAGLMMLAWFTRLRPDVRMVPLTGALTLMGLGVIGLTQPVIGLFHELWAGMLLAVAVAFDRPGTRALALAAGLAALLVREFALPMVLCLAGLALVERRWRDAAGWALAVGMFAVAVMLHARAVAAVVMPGDLASLGWNGLIGVGFALKSLATVTPVAILPSPVAANLLLALSLFGWASVRSGWSIRAGLLVAGYLLMIALFARRDNFYWALMAAPLALAGLAFVPLALTDLVRSLRGVREAQA